MSRSTLFFRLVLAVVLFPIPGFLLGIALHGRAGALIGFFVSLVAATMVAIASEKGIARAYMANDQGPKGLERTLSLVTDYKETESPRILVFPDPSPNALVARALGSEGTIFLSQGLLALLNEAELRIVIRLCKYRLKERGVVFQSFCAVLAVWALSSAPRAWVNLVFAGRTLSRMEERRLSPISVVGFLMVFPIVRLFLSLAKSSSQKPKQVVSEMGEAYSAAMQKVTQSVHIWGPSKHQGAFSLYFVDPGSGQMLFPYD